MSIGNYTPFTCPAAAAANPREVASDAIEPVTSRVKKALAERLKTTESDLNLVQSRQVTWENPDLGVKVDHIVFPEATDGYHLVFTSVSKERQYCVHTSIEADNLKAYLHNPNSTEPLRPAKAPPSHRVLWRKNIFPDEFWERLAQIPPHQRCTIM